MSSSQANTHSGTDYSIPFPLSLINAIGNPARKVLLPLDVDRSQRLAERVTGLSDFGSDDFKHRLDRAVAVVRDEDLNMLGHFAVYYLLHWGLGNRLRAVEALKQHPEVRDTRVERPVVITGLFRTGTTFLHHVLAADPAHRTATFWELSRPVGRPRDPLGDVRWRKWRNDHEIKMDAGFFPNFDEAHQVIQDNPEEDFLLLESAMCFMMLIIAQGCYPLGTAMLDWDFEEPYRWHREQLKLLWRQRAEKRWLLKCPWHLWYLDDFMKVYPDALIIQTHRDPVPTIGSQCSMSARLATKFQTKYDFERAGRFWLEYSLAGLERGLAARTQIASDQVYDVRLKDLRSNPVDIIEDIYSQFGLEFSSDLAQRLAARAAEEPTQQAGEHEYDIAEFGLSESEIRENFAEYCERFGV